MGERGQEGLTPLDPVLAPRMHLCIFIQPELLPSGVCPCPAELAELGLAHGVGDELVIHQDTIREPLGSNVAEECFNALFLGSPFKVIGKACAPALDRQVKLGNVASGVVCRVSLAAYFAGQRIGKLHLGKLPKIRPFAKRGNVVRRALVRFVVHIRDTDRVDSLFHVSDLLYSIKYTRTRAECQGDHVTLHKVNNQGHAARDGIRL